MICQFRRFNQSIHYSDGMNFLKTIFEVSSEISFVVKVIYSYKKSSQIDFKIYYFQTVHSTATSPPNSLGPNQNDKN